MFFLASVCNHSEVLKVIYFIQELLRIIFIIVPMLLIVMVSIDFGKNVIGKESDMSKNVSMVIKRIIAAVFLFLVPTVVSLIISLVGETTTFTTCLNNANLSYIHDMQVLEEEEKIRREEEAKNKSPLSVVDLSNGSGVATTGGGSTTVASSGTLPSDKKYYPINGKKNGKELKNLEIDGKWLSDSEMKDISSAIKRSINSSDDWGTRVALAGWSLIYYSSEKGVKIHYQLGGNGLHKAFYHGWGTKLSSEAVNSRCSKDNSVNYNNDCGNGKDKYVGMDCTQFIRWAVYNGCGISVTASCSNNSKVICYTDRSKFSRTSDYDDAKPGDILIKNGHVVLFLKKSGSDYYIAETTRGKGHGTLINKYTKSGLKKDGFEVIQMTDGYKKYCKK